MNKYGLYEYTITKIPWDPTFLDVVYGGGTSYKYNKRERHTDWSDAENPILWYRDITYEITISHSGNLTNAGNDCEGSKVPAEPVWSNGLWRSTNVTAITEGAWTKAT